MNQLGQGASDPVRLIRDEADWVGHINYLHYNPVKHGLVECPHQWEFSSFRRFVRDGFYGEDWGCCCGGKEAVVEFEGEGGGE